MKKSVSRVISLILCVAMVLTIDLSGVSTAFAADNDQEAVTTEQGSSGTGSSDSSQDYHPVELKSLIDEDGFLTDEGLESLQSLPNDPKKYFEEITNIDGTKSLRVFSSPIKFKDNEGEYQYIDNSVIESPLNGYYKNKASDIEILMPNSLDETTSIYLNYLQYSVAFKTLDLLKTDKGNNAELVYINLENKVENDSSYDENKRYNSIEYSGTFYENADINITPVSSGIKEDIVLNSKPQKSEFSYELTIENMIPLLRKDGNVYFVDLNKNVVVGIIAAPVMHDSSIDWEYSEDISVELKQTGENTYIYTLKPNKSYLEKAVYPVIIDPTFNVIDHPNVGDTYVKCGYTGNYCSSSNVVVGRNSSGVKYRGLFKIYQDELDYLRQTYGTNITITQVKLHTYEGYSGASSPTIQLYPALDVWHLNTVTWANQPDYPANYYCAQTVHAVGWYEWDVTPMAKDWYYETTSYYGQFTYGVMLRIANESLNQYKTFNSQQNSSNHNYFEFTYTDATPPTAPTSVYTEPNAGTRWTNDNTVRLHWTGITDACSGLNRVEYKINSGSWKSTGSSASTGYKDITLTQSGPYTLYVRGVDNYENVGPSRSVAYKLDMSFSGTPQQPTVTAIDGTADSGDSAQIRIGFDAVPDSLSGTAYYQILENGSVLSGYDHITGVSGHWEQTLTGYRFDYATYAYKIRVYDNAGNYQTSAATSVTTADRTGPVIEPADIAITPDTWTNGNPTISWGTISDLGGGLDNNSEGTGAAELKYQIGSAQGTWVELGDYEDGQATIDTSLWDDGEYQIYIAAFDQEGNTSNTDNYLIYKKDGTAPTGEIITPADENIIKDSSYQISATLSDDNDVSWILDWALGIDPLESGFNGHVIASGDTALEETDYETWNLTGLEENRLYTIRLRAVDEAGNILRDEDDNEGIRVVVLFAYDTDQVPAQFALKIYDLATEEDLTENDNIAVPDVGVEPPEGVELDEYELYVNDELADEGTPADMPAFNALEYDEGTGQWVYPEGSQVFLRMTGTDSDGEYYYSYGTYQGHVIVEVFDEEADAEISEGKLSAKNNIMLDDTNDCIKLSDISENGYIVSSKQTVNGLINYVVLTVDQDIPAGASITYYLVCDGVEIEIDPNDSEPLNIPTNDFYLKAVFTSNGSETPTLSSWSLDVMYIAFGDSVVIDNSFDENARGFQNLNNTVHNETAGNIELYYDESTHEYATTGTVESTVRVTPGNVWEIFLSVDEDYVVAGETEIKYYLSTDGGITWSNVPITVGTDPNDKTQWILLKDLGINMVSGNQIAIKAELKILTTDHSVSPVLKSWSLQCRQTLTGNAYDIQLIDAPDNLSTLVDANYMTLLRWEPSETEGVTYNIYRSTMPYFTPSEDTYLDSTDNNSYNDFNIQYSTTFYYKVTTEKEFTGSDGYVHPRESLPSNEAWATTVSEDELNKMLGLESYWSYSGFQTGGGTGYVNIASSNLTYQTTDLVVSDPFLAAVMARTYNSTAGTKTPMGYGWDYSFNTCLLKEYDENEVFQAMILKDGDGSFHRFEYNSATDSYSDAVGTYMQLTAVRNEENEIIRYEIKRKDDITYYFDAETMKLTQFTDNNGTTLTLLYDYDIDDGDDSIPDTTDRGNLKQIITSAGEIIELDYYVDGSEPGQGDYIYVNSNVDMVKSITWTEDTITDPESITYTYIYNQDDQLETVNVELAGEVTRFQSFSYDEDMDNMDTPDYNFVVTDAEDRITIVSTNADGQVTTVYDPIQVDAGDTDPLLNHVENYNSFILYDWDGNGESDTTVIRNNHNVTFQYDYDEDGLVTMKTDWEFGYCFYYNHNANYQVTSVTYPNTYYGVSASVILTYSYDSNGNIEQIKAYRMNEDGSGYSALGTQTDYTYCTNHPNKVETVTVAVNASDSIVTSYTYDANGNVLTMVVADGSVNADNEPIEKTTTYEYYPYEDPANNPDGLEWQLKSVTDEYGCETRYIYDSRGRVTDVKVYDADGTYVKTTAHYTYDGFSRTDTVSQPYVTSATAVTDLQYDDYGRLVLKVNADNTAEQWDYDMTGWLTTYAVGTYSNGSFAAENSTSYEYDLLGRLKSTTVENDPTMSSDDTTSTVSYGYWDSTGWSGDNAEKVTTTDAEGVQTIQYYNTLGRLVKTQIYDGTTYITTAEYTYDTIGNVIKAVDNAGTVTEVCYDEMNRQIETIVDPFNSTDGKDNLNIETHYTYDYLGNALTSTQYVYESESNQSNPQQITTEYTYDDLSRLVQVTQANPDYVSGSSDPEEAQYITTQYYYDQQGTENTDWIMNYTEDAKGYISETYFNELGQKVESFNRGDTSDGDNDNTTTQEYQKSTYGYADTNSDGNYALGLVDTVTRTDGTKEVYTYDEMGRVLRVDYYEANMSTSAEYVVYAYNDLGQVLTETRTSNGTTHATSYRYDRLGRTSSVWEGTYVNGDKSVVAGGLDIEYTYNDAGQLITLNYNSGSGPERNLVYEYDGYGRISEIGLEVVDDPNTQEVESESYIVRQYTYDTTTGVLLYTRDYREFATVTSGLGDYIQTDYEYNSAGLVSQITYSDADFSDGNNTAGTTEKYVITYDGRGQIVGEQLNTDYSTAADTTTVYKAYDYDSLGRLVTAVSGDNDAGTTWSNWDNMTTYAYDLDGNRETMDNTTSSTTTSYAYTYNQFNQLTATTKNSEAYESYTYDLRGNQNTDSKAYLDVTVDDVTTTYNQTTTYDYDLSNQMAHANISTPVADQSGNVTYEDADSLNIYNESGQRVNKTDGTWDVATDDTNSNGEIDEDEIQDANTEKYFYTGSAILYTKNQHGDLLTENILSPSGQIIASKRFDDDGDPGTTYELANLYFFYHYDIRGSVMAIVRPDGTLIEGYTYDEFGNLTWTEYDSNGDPVEAVDEIFDNEVTYTGSITDTSTGLQYMNARYYDSSTGRFLTQDTYTGNAYEPWTQHLYSYCGNNPTNMIDPTGHIATIADGIEEEKKARNDNYRKKHPSIVPEPEDGGGDTTDGGTTGGGNTGGGTTGGGNTGSGNTENDNNSGAGLSGDSEVEQYLMMLEMAEDGPDPNDEVVTVTSKSVLYAQALGYWATRSISVYYNRVSNGISIHCISAKIETWVGNNGLFTVEEFYIKSMKVGANSYDRMFRQPWEVLESPNPVVYVDYGYLYFNNLFLENGKSINISFTYFVEVFSEVDLLSPYGGGTVSMTFPSD